MSNDNEGKDKKILLDLTGYEAPEFLEELDIFYDGEDKPCKVVSTGVKIKL